METITLSVMSKAEHRPPKGKIVEIIQIKDRISPQNFYLWYNAFVSLERSSWKQVHLSKKQILLTYDKNKIPQIKIKLNACKHSKKTSSLVNCYDGRTEEGSTREKETESVNTKSPAINKGH